MTTLELQIKWLKKQIEEMQTKLNQIENETKLEKDIPKISDVYYYIDDIGNINSSIYQMTIEDEDRIKIGNYFKTKEEAEFDAERRKVISELKKYAVKNPVWNKGYHYHFIYYFSDFECISDRQTVYPIGDIVFESGDILMQAINEVGEDRVKKYYLRMED